jgi:hypothetical protein
MWETPHLSAALGCACRAFESTGHPGFLLYHHSKFMGWEIRKPLATDFLCGVTCIDLSTGERWKAIGGRYDTDATAWSLSF